MTAPSGPPFSVSYRPAVRARLQTWADRAVRAGLRVEFLEAVRDLDQQLHSRPREWGDPQYGYHTLELTLYRRYGPVFVVYYVVHNTKNVVFVQDIELVAAGPFA